MCSIMRRLVHLVRDLGDDDALALGACASTSISAAARTTRRPRPVRYASRMPRAPVDDAAGREVRARHQYFMMPSMSHRRIRRAAPRWRRRSRVRLCGGMLVAMPTAMPDEPFTSRFGTTAGSTSGIVARVVVVGPEVDGVLVEIGQHLAGDGAHARFGIALGRRRVAVHRAEVALAVDQRVAQRELLRHAHQRVVHRGGAVRMVVRGDVAGDLRGLAVRPIAVQVQVVHRGQDAPVHRLQPVAHVRQRARNDDAHRVIEIRRRCISSSM